MKKGRSNSNIHLLFFLCTTLSISCSNVNSNSSEDSIKKDTIQKTQANQINDLIIGVWGIDEQPSFEIKNDSIFYIDSDKSYKYSISDSNITIFYEDFIYKGIINVRGDKTLIIKDSLNTNIYKRE
jgi:hypothetical protein